MKSSKMRETVFQIFRSFQVSRRRYDLLVAVALLAFALGGCGVIGMGGKSVDDQQATLRQRPDIEQISARYEQMQAEVRDRLTAEIGGLAWVNDDNESRSGCGFDFSDVHEGESRLLARWTALGNLPDARWDDAVAIVQEITGEYGFGTPEVVLDRPGNHRIVVPDSYGGTLNFGTSVNTILRMYTGCHLPPSGS